MIEGTRTTKTMGAQQSVPDRREAATREPTHQWGSAATATSMDLIGAAGALGWADATYSGSQVSSNTVDSTMGSTPSSGEEGGAPLRRRLSSKTKCEISQEEQEFFDSMEQNIRRKQSYGGPKMPDPEPHQWTNFIGGTLNSVSREHKPHYMFRTVPYMDMDILHKHNKHLNCQRPAKIPLKRRNSSSSVELCLVIDDLDVQAMIKVTSLVLHHHISEGCAMSWPIDPRFNIFNDPPGMEVGSKGGSNGGASRSSHSAAWGGEGGGWGARGSSQRSPPSYAEVLEFYSYVFKTAQLEKDCVIMSLVYIERVLTETAGKLRIFRKNWRSVILCGLILASKIWDDLSMWNCDFSKVGRCSLRRINELEVAVLQVLQYNVRVPSSLFASYYFRMRHWCILLGVETPGLYDAPPPRRRSESLKATEAMAIADAARKAAEAGRLGGAQASRVRREAAAAAAALVAEEDLKEGRLGSREAGAAGAGGKERDNLLLIGGAAATRAPEGDGVRGVPGISHRLDGRVYRSCYSRLPPSLEELVDMTQTDAGGRKVLPRDHQRHERHKSISSCILRRQKKATLQNLILSEVGDVRSNYDVSGNDSGTRRSSKVDLAEAAGSTGVGAILGVGISGLVQVVRHKKTGVSYAMKTLRLGRLEDFHKTDELRNEIVVMSQLNHPNICRLLEIYESPTRDSICLILELCTGGELLSRLNKVGHYSEKRCCELVRKMLSAVRHCHAHGLCHRDLKLENWVFESDAPDAELKLIDFGLSTYFGKDQVMHVPVGTPYSIAPECLTGGYTVQCDLWSVGVLTFMMLAGEPPFTGRDDFEVLEAVKAGKWEWPERVSASVSEGAKAFVAGLLVVDPAQRLTCELALKHSWMQATQAETELPNPLVMESLQSFESLGTIKKLVLRMIAFTLEAWQVESLRREFRKCDRACNGLITLQDLRAALVQQGLLGNGLDTVGLGKMFDAAQGGPGESGVIRYNDFLAASLTSKEDIILDDVILKAAFDRFDRSHAGEITGRDLRLFLGKELDDEEIDKMLKEAGLQHGGSMNFEEFKELMQNTLHSPSLSRAGSCPLPAN
ncbi:unnamed protein product [Scytosiphon promiscuus]